MLSRTRIVASVSAVAVAVAFAGLPAAAAVPKSVAYDYATYTYRGASHVQITGDNASGVLVGTEGSNRHVRAFYLVDHHYHLLTVPFVQDSASVAYVAGITNGGEIVGSSDDKGRMFGWVRNAHTHHYTRFSIPGSEDPLSLGTWPESVSPYGVISGLYYTFNPRKDKGLVERFVRLVTSA
jgi:hypothetical protein